MPSLTRPVVDVVADLSDAIARGDRDLARALAVTDAAKVGLRVSAEAAACGLAMVCIHDERETGVGHGELQARAWAARCGVCRPVVPRWTLCRAARRTGLGAPGTGDCCAVRGHVVGQT